MPAVDIIILVIILLSSLVSFARGFFREAMSLIGWGVAIAAAFLFADEAAVYFEKWIADYTLRYVVAAVVVFFIALMAIGVVNYLLGHFILSVGVNGTDRILGVLLGLARGIIIVSLILWVLHPDVLNYPVKEHWPDSNLLAHFDPIVDWLREHLSSFAQDWSDKAVGGGAQPAEPSVMPVEPAPVPVPVEPSI